MRRCARCDTTPPPASWFGPKPGDHYLSDDTETVMVAGKPVAQVRTGSTCHATATCVSGRHRFPETRLRCVCGAATLLMNPTADYYEVIITDPTPPAEPRATGRPDWADYFMAVAAAVATRADCSRRQVGAVIVKDNRIVATGYNGAPAGEPGCLTAGACPRASSDVASGSSYDTGPGSCIALHAEANALLYADRDDVAGSTVYVTYRPCDGCRKLLAGARVAHVVHPD